MGTIRTIAIDWDHTLMNGKEWLPGAKDALKRLREEGHRIIIHSCNDPNWIEMHLRDAGIIADVWRGAVNRKGEIEPKPVADLYIDDRAYRFPTNGDWSKELDKVLERLSDIDIC